MEEGDGEDAMWVVTRFAQDDVLEVQRRDMSVSFDDLMRRFEVAGEMRRVVVTDR